MTTALDSRAYAWCNLGPLAAGSSVAESHAQTAGVVTCRGTINLAGIYRPAPGTVVRLAYSDGQNWLARLPVRLLVLSSFSNPLGANPTTSVSVGCDLTYFDNRKQPPASLTARDANPTVAEAVWRAAAPSISAAWLVAQILAALGLTAAGAIPLTNHYTRQEFDLTGGYVEELGRLCQSEGYLARMNVAGQVEFISKDQGLGTSVLLTDADLIDLNPINSGELPGDSVYAKFTSLTLKAPEEPTPDDPTGEVAAQRRNWEREVSISAPQTYIHQWTEYAKQPVYDASGNPTYRQRKDANGRSVFVVTQTQYRQVPNGVETIQSGNAVMDQVFQVNAYQLYEEINYITRTETLTNYDSKNRAIERRTTTTGLWGVDYSETFFYYRDGAAADGSDDELIREVTTEFSPLAPLKMSVGYQLPYASLRGMGAGDQYQSSYRETLYQKDKASGITKTITTSLVPFMSTTNGSEVISRLRDVGNQLDSSRLAFILDRAKQLVSAGSETRIRTEREFGVQRRPSEAERTTSDNLKAPAVEQTAESVWAVGSAASQTQVELSPPYTPDDRIVESGGVYSVIRSDAAQKALNYARIENRLLLAHRNGNGIQVLPELLPPAPLGLIYIRLNGATAAFRTNGTTWNLDSEGVTATTDALFWGAIDGALANVWFPLAPGVAALPAPVAISTNATPRPANAIAIPSGFNFNNPNLTSLFASLPTAQAPTFLRTVTPGVLVTPWTETVKLMAGSGSGAFATIYPWANKTVEVLAGSGSGIVATRRRVIDTLAGSGSGVIATLGPRILTVQSFAGSGSGVITTLSAASAIAIGTRLSGNAAPLLGGSPAVTFTGWSRIVNARADDDNVLFGNWPFTFFLAGTGYTACYPAANGYATFGAGSTLYSGLGANTPALPKIMFGAADIEYQRVYTQTANTFARFRWEGHNDRNGVAPGSSGRIVEVTFLKPGATSQLIEVRTGNWIGSGTSTLMLASASTSYASTTTMSANQSWVFEGNLTGTSWTLYGNSYVVT